MIGDADTSWWIARIFEGDHHHQGARFTFDRWPNRHIVWTPWQRVEIFNGLNQLERGGLLELGEARRGRRLLELEVRLGFWPHREFSWTNAIRQAVTLSYKLGIRWPIGSLDLFHVAVAQVLKADAFVSFDDEQCAFARAAGLNVLVPLPRRQTRRCPAPEVEGGVSMDGRQPIT